ncbi:MAG: pseudouridine synthase [Hyphomicrobiales bacterium]
MMTDKNGENDGAGERISKVVSRAGIASRRDVERMIAEGRIALNGQTVTTPVTLVQPGDRIFVDGVALAAKERTRLFLYHKPVGLVTTEKDPEGRPTVFSALPPGLPRLVSVGRLDLNTEGLLLLTNDGGLARVLAHPTTGWLRRYRVRAFGEIAQERLDGLKDGIEIDGMHYGPVEAQIDREQGSNMWLTLGLREGKNREVKRILEHFGLQVNRLIRISFGPFQLGDLAEGAVEEVRTRTLKEQLGAQLAREAHADFDGEAEKRPERPSRREASFGERAGRAGRASLERPSKGDAGPDEARALRKAAAIAQGRRSAAHRHSWRDAESWAARGERKDGASGGAPKAHREPGRGSRGPKVDERQHLRGGRIADRKGRSILVERVVQDPAASAPSRESVGEPRRPRSHREERSHVAPRENDVLRRRTLRERGLAPRGHGDERERGPPPARLGRDRPVGDGRPFGTRRREDRRINEAQGETRAPRRFDRPDPRKREDRPPRREGADRPYRKPDDRPARPARPFRSREERSAAADSTPRPHRDVAVREARPPSGPRPQRRWDRKDEGGAARRPGERPRRDGSRGDGPRGDGPRGDKPWAERSRGEKSRDDGTAGFKPRSSGPGGSRTGGFRTRKDRPAKDRPFRDRPGGARPVRPPRKPRS